MRSAHAGARSNGTLCTGSRPMYVPTSSEAISEATIVPGVVGQRAVSATVSISWAFEMAQSTPKAIISGGTHERDLRIRMDPL